MSKYKGTLKDCPCKDCETDRDDSCHCRCKEYVEWRQARADMLAGINSEKDRETLLTEYDIAKSKRIYKR